MMWNKKEDKSPVSPAGSAPSFEPTPAPPSPQRPAPASDITRITATVKIKGEVTSREDLFVDGEVHGTIRLTDAEVTVGTNGRVTADIDARSINVEGKVIGKLTARERIRLGRASSVEGEIVAPRLAVEEGAVFRGHVDLTQAASAPKSQLARAAGSTSPSTGSAVPAAPALAKAGDA